ncbi:hypothetical protein [Alcaligenes sp. Marseille-Q7550]
MTLYDDDDRKVLESLRKSVAKALDRKRRLGQYAVVWQDGKPVYIGPNPPLESALSDAPDSLAEPPR